MCKAKIEETLAFTKGVKTSELDLESKIVTVTYNPVKITPEKIRRVISGAGYDADSILAEILKPMRSFRHVAKSRFQNDINRINPVQGTF